MQQWPNHGNRFIFGLKAMSITILSKLNSNHNAFGQFRTKLGIFEDSNCQKLLTYEGTKVHIPSQLLPLFIIGWAYYFVMT